MVGRPAVESKVQSPAFEGLTARPAVLAACALAGGIQIAEAAGIWHAAAGLAAAGIVLGILRSRRWTGPMAALLAFCALGATRYALSSAPAPDDISRVANRGYVTVRGTVASDVEIRPRGLTCQIATRSLTLQDGSAVPCSGRVAARLAWSDGGPALDYGDSLQARGMLAPPEGQRNEGGFDYAGYLAHHGVYSTLLVRRASSWRVLPTGLSPGDWIPHVASLSRDSLLRSLGRVLPRAESGLAAGILLGARTELPKSLNDDFVATGTVHILATAGLHVGIFGGLVLGLLRLCRVRRKPAAVILLAALLVYTIMAGARPSVLRASLMAAVFLVGLLLEREGDVPNAMGVAAIALLLVEPGYLFDVGFQLSFATVGTIVALMPVLEVGMDPVRRRAKRAPGWPGRLLDRALMGLGGAIGVSAAAQIGSGPFTAEHFNLVSFSGIAANAVIVPLLIVVFAAGFVVWGMALIWVPAAKLVSTVVLSPVLSYLVGAAHFFARLPAASVNVPSPGWPLIAIYYLVIAAAVARQRIGQARSEGEAA